MSSSRNTVRIALSAFGVLLVVVPIAAATTTAYGSYVEARTADVFTGPCFANAEVGLVGREALLAWWIEGGSWAGVDLADLSVVAVVKARSTLGDPFAVDRSSSAILLVDERAESRQREALVAFARSQTDGLLDDVLDMVAVPIHFEPGSAGAARVEAGDIARLHTRGLTHEDHLCGNEIVLYPPLADVEGAVPGVTLEHTWSGQGLRSTWRSPGKRSSFVASFGLSSPQAEELVSP